MKEVMVASLIENALRDLPIHARPDVILLDADLWEDFIYEIQTSTSLSNTELRYMWIAACEILKRKGIPVSKVFQIECPEMRLRFRRNPYIKGVRVLYSLVKRRAK
jgi:hypothetical protein